MPGRNVVDAILAAVLAASLALPLLPSGAEGMWMLPPLSILDGRVVTSSLVLIGTIVAAAYAIERIDARAGALAGLVCLPLALVFHALGPQTRIGDWDWVMWIAESGHVVGRWWGAAWAYGGFHQLLAPFGFTPLESVRALSSLAGAGCLWVYYLILRELGAVRLLRVWPFLYLSAFGVVGVGLAHVELYAVVALMIGLVLWTGVRVVERASVMGILVFATLTAAAATLYASCVFLLPLAGGVLLWTAARGRSSRPILQAALGALPLMALILWSAAHFDPAPSDESLWQFWSVELRSRPTGLTAPAFHPDDVFWPLASHLLRPRYWFSDWHLRSFLGQLFLDDRSGAALAVGLVLAGAWTWMKRGRIPFSRATVFLLIASLPFAAFAFTSVNVRPEPFDWDVWSYVGLVTSVLAASLLADVARGEPLARRTGLLIVALGIASLFSGFLFLHAHASEPAEHGPPVGGFSLAVLPTRIHVRADGQALEPVWLWLYNDTDEHLTLRVRSIRYGFSESAPSSGLPPRPEVRSVLGSRPLTPRAYLCLADVLPAFEVSDAVSRGVLVAQLTFEHTVKPLRLISNPIELVVAVESSR